MLLCTFVDLKQHRYFNFNTDKHHIFHLLHRTEPCQHCCDTNTDWPFHADVMPIKIVQATRFVQSPETGATAPGSKTQGLVLITYKLLPLY